MKIELWLEKIMEKETEELVIKVRHKVKGKQVREGCSQHQQSQMLK